MVHRYNFRRLGALLLALCLTVLFLLSTFFVIRHARHNCSGSHCKICREITHCLSAVRHLAVPGEGSLPAAGNVPLLLVAALLAAPSAFRQTATPVILKVRLDN